MMCRKFGNTHIVEEVATRRLARIQQEQIDKGYTYTCRLNTNSCIVMYHSDLDISCATTLSISPDFVSDFSRKLGKVVEDGMSIFLGRIHNLGEMSRKNVRNHEFVNRSRVEVLFGPIC